MITGMKRKQKFREVFQGMNKVNEVKSAYKSSRRWMVIVTVIVLLFQIKCALYYQREQRAEWVTMHKDGYSFSNGRSKSMYVDMSYQGKQYSHQVDEIFKTAHKYVDTVRVKYLADADYVALYDGEEGWIWMQTTVVSLVFVIICVIRLIVSRREWRKMQADTGMEWTKYLPYQTKKELFK